MSKHCEVCKRSYSDELADCPYCAEPVELRNEDVVEALPENAEISIESDSAVDLGLPAVPANPPGGGSGASDASGISFIEWASLVEEKSTPPTPRASADQPHPAHEIPSDSGRGLTEDAAPPAAPDDPEDALAGDLAAVRSIFSGDPSASFSRQPPAPDPSAPITDADDSALDLLAPNEPEKPPTVEAADSGIDLVAADLEEELVSDAAPLRPAAEAGDSGILVEDSGVNLSEADLVEDLPQVEARASGSAGQPASDDGIDLSGADIVAAGEDSGHLSGIEKNSPDSSESGRDLIAEEVESSVNMSLNPLKAASDKADGTGDAVAGQLASEEEEVDLTEMSPADVVDSSSVDLGASATFPAAPPESVSAPPAESPRPHQSASRNIHGEEELSPSEVDLGGREEPAKASGLFDESGGLSGSAAPLEMEDDKPSSSLEDEESVDAAEEVEDEEEPKRPAKGKKERLPSTAVAWGGGGVLGAIVATGACLALWYFNILPSKESQPRTGVPAATTNTSAPQVQAPLTFADKAAAVRSGDLERAQKADIETVDETKAEEVAARGEYRARNYLARQSADKKPIEANDPELQAAVKDLESASKAPDPVVAADALFYLGFTREVSKDYEGALKAYKEGADRFKGDAAQKERFDAGISRMTTMLAGATGRAAPADDDALLALLLTALQASDPAKPADPTTPAKPVAPAPAPPPAGEESAFTEAGSAFWQAAAKAREGKYDDALAAIKQASELHTRRRFTRLGKAQNPNSDPTEEIFLRSCEELKNYWELQKNLSASGLPLVKGKGAVAAVDAVLAENKSLSDKLAKAAADAMTQQKAVEAAEKNAEEAKKEADKTKKDFETTQKDLLTAKDDAKAKKNDLEASKKNAEDLTEKLKTAEGTAAKEGEALKGIAGALTPKFLQAGAGEAALLPAVKDAARLAAIADPQGTIHGLQTEVAGLNSTLKQRWEPNQMLTFWMPLLQERGRADLADKAVIDADRVLKEAKSSPQDKARAHAVKGIALRNEEKYAEAKAELEQAKANLSKEDSVWGLEVEAALKEASDPPAYFAARAEELRKAGRIPEALAMLDKAPAAKGPLMVERGALHFDQALAHGKGVVAANDPDLVAARKDADEAKKSGTADAFYLSGRIEEQVGQTDEALQDYRQALKAHGALDADGARYRAAVARMLMLPRRNALAPISKGAGASGLDVLIALVAVGVQPGELNGPNDPAVQEAVKLADEILSAKESDVPFEARAQAYAIKGLWTPALRTYVEGLRPYLHPEHAAGLLAIINGHPNLRRPSLMTIADPVEAEKHYAAGLHWYNEREYPKAEKEFFTAVEQDGQDARYYYYLGLAQLMQGDHDAFEDFEQGGRLEAQNRPPRAAVSAALERVQGPARLRLNDVRDRPR